MLIGIDLDHTIIDYGQAFNGVAKEWGLVPKSFEGSKADLREYLKVQDLHQEWMRLQGYVYGKGLGYARVMPGFIDFIHTCRQRGAATVIVSHKTVYGHFDVDQVNLREAALNWLENNFFFEVLGFEPKQIYFAATKEEKLERITSLKCTHFIDDLWDIVVHPLFPSKTQAFWLSDVVDVICPKSIHQCVAWSDVQRAVFEV